MDVQYSFWRVLTLQKHCWAPVLVFWIIAAKLIILLLLSSAFRFYTEHLCPYTHKHTSQTSAQWVSGASWSRCVRAVCSADESRGPPVWLVKVDIVGLSPVCEHYLLGDEAMVASLSTPFVGEIHGALVRSPGLIVMIWHRGVGGGPARWEEDEKWGEQKVCE